MTTDTIITRLQSAINRSGGLVWQQPQVIGNGEVAVYMRSGFGILASPHRFAGATFTVVWDDGTEYDMDSTFNNAGDAVTLAESI